ERILLYPRLLIVRNRSLKVALEFRRKRTIPVCLSVARHEIQDAPSCSAAKGVVRIPRLLGGRDDRPIWQTQAASTDRLRFRILGSSYWGNDCSVGQAQTSCPYRLPL